MLDFVVWLALGGGLFAIMVFIHFAVDWIFQTHSEAMAKHNNWKVRARHCMIYTLGFLPLIAFLSWCRVLHHWQYWASLAILFFSHFVEDTYLPVYYWAKFIRKPPEMTQPIKWVDKDGEHEGINPMEGFKQFVQTGLGKILMIAIDQIIHIAFLFPIVFMVMWNMMHIFYAIMGHLQ